MPDTEEILLNEDIYERGFLAEKYKTVRSFTEFLCQPLETEDYVIQSMPDVSPTKWHLAHTSWFFEAFLLDKIIKNYKPYNTGFFFLFNSYYTQMGERHTRAFRGLISRPTVAEVYKYRKYIDEQVMGFIASCSEKKYKDFLQVIEIGINHEQQHQELLLTDIKHVLSCNPLHPVYRFIRRPDILKPPPFEWAIFTEGITQTGADEFIFSYDNERPRHKTYINKFKIASRLVTNAEYIEFIEDNGYSRPELWLSDGFSQVENNKWNSPLYWIKQDNHWYYFTLSGLEKIKLNEPVCHVSYYEADAYARWKNCRLPTEHEWEKSAPDKIKGNFVEEMFFNPAALEDDIPDLQQFYGDVWEWTCSAYLPYPGFKTLPGALGEYNGKFMSNQMVLRGGSCATPVSHIRKTYRNFFPPHSRWQFMGIRLASDIL